MSRNSIGVFDRARLTIAMSAVLLSSGCASVPLDRLATTAESEERQQYRSELMRSFENRRNHAQYQAALARCQEKDFTAAEAMLVKLLEREPDHRDARQLLADLYLELGKPAECERHLRTLVEQQPGDAPAHYSLALFLDTTGRAEEAQVHFQQAAALEPQNELYSLSARPVR